MALQFNELVRTTRERLRRWRAVRDAGYERILKGSGTFGVNGLCDVRPPNGSRCARQRRVALLRSPCGARKSTMSCAPQRQTILPLSIDARGALPRASAVNCETHRHPQPDY
jgi:hypothetical protein